MTVATPHPTVSGVSVGTRMAAGLAAIVFLFATYPVWGQMTEVALDYWLRGNTSFPAFSQQLERHGAFGTDATRIVSVGFITLSIALLAVFAPVTMLVRASGRFEGLGKALAVLMSVSATLFGFAFLYYLGGFGGAGTQLGTIAMGIYAGSTLAFVALFVAYRYLEAVRNGNDLYETLFARQLIVVALSPWLFQITYGLWFIVFGHSFDGGYWQQMTASFASFLLPMLVIYMYTTLARSSETDKLGAGLLIGAIILCLLGSYGYATSDIQPKLI